MKGYKKVTTKKLEDMKAKIDAELSNRIKRRLKSGANKLIGNCYRFKNCYSLPERASDYWWFYVKITHMDEHGVLRGTAFQRDKEGKIEIDKNAYVSVASIVRYEPLADAVFDVEFLRIIEYAKRIALSASEEGDVKVVHRQTRKKW